MLLTHFAGQKILDFRLRLTTTDGEDEEKVFEDTPRALVFAIRQNITMLWESEVWFLDMAHTK